MRSVFAAPPQAAYREIRRILEPGGRAVLTCWETDDRDDERVPARLRQVDLRDDPALRSLHDEGVRSLRMLDLVRRVLATATAP